MTARPLFFATIALVLAGASVAQPVWTPVAGVVGGAMSVEFNARNLRTVYVGGSEDRVFVSHDGGRTARLLARIRLGPVDPNGVPRGSVTALFVHPVDTLFVFAGSTHGAYLSRDGGQSWAHALPHRNVVLNGLSVAVEPGDPDALYVAVLENVETGHNFYRSRDRGRTWTASMVATGGSAPGFCSVAAAGGGVLLAGSSALGGILRSADGGATWTHVHTAESVSFDVPRVVFDPRDPDVAWAAVFGFDPQAPGYVVRSDDGGRTWGRVGALDGVNPWAIEPDGRGRVFVGAWGLGAAGAYASLDGGGSWRLVPLAPDPLPDAYVITWMARSDGAGALYLADHYRGAFRLDLTTGADPAAAPAPLDLAVRPNPARGSVAVRFALGAPGPARLTLHDALGREVAARTGVWPAGPGTASFDAATLAPGVYLLRLSTPAGTATRPLVVAR